MGLACPEGKLVGGKAASPSARPSSTPGEYSIPPKLRTRVIKWIVLAECLNSPPASGQNLCCSNPWQVSMRLNVDGTHCDAKPWDCGGFFCLRIHSFLIWGSEGLDFLPTHESLLATQLSSRFPGVTEKIWSLQSFFSCLWDCSMSVRSQHPQRGIRPDNIFLRMSTASGSQVYQHISRGMLQDKKSSVNKKSFLKGKAGRARDLEDYTAVP